MKPIKFFTKIKLVFNTFLVLLISTPVILLLLIIIMLRNSLRTFQEPHFTETVRRFKILICILFYSIAIIFIKNHKNDTKLRCLMRKINNFKRK